MEPARSIGKLGFKRWYERQLLEGHAWLVSCFLCGLAALALLEGFSFRAHPIAALVKLAFIFVGGLFSWHALRRYRVIMEEAERLSQHATCSACHTYAAFSVIREYPKVNVRCRKCGHEWLLD